MHATAHPSDVLSGVMASFTAAADASGRSSARRHEMAGAPIVLNFAGTEVRDVLGSAFEHLATPSENGSSRPELTVHLWDSASNASPPPPRPATPNDFAVGAMFHFHDGPLRGVYEPGTEALSILDLDSGLAWYWVRDIAKVPYWDRASPMRQVLFWWLRSRRYLQVHGSAVGTSNGGVLMVGRRGSGKSVTSLSVLGSTLLFAADDYSAVSMDEPHRIASIYSAGKLVPEQGEKLLPHLMPLVSNPDRLEGGESSALYAPALREPDHEGLPAPGDPRANGARNTARVADRRHSAHGRFAALAPSTILQLRTANQEELTVMSELVKRVPSYGIELGTDHGVESRNDRRLSHAQHGLRIGHGRSAR